MPQRSVARRYAKAFIEVTSRLGVVEPVGKDLLALADVLAQHRELRIALQNPAVDVVSRKTVLEEVLRRLGANSETRRLVNVLIERDRLDVLADVASVYRDLSDEAAGRLRAEVVAAERLDEVRLGKIRRALEGLTGKRVVIEHREDPSLLAGVVTRLGSWVYDGSLQTQLNALRESLLQR